jgi:gamma-glutamyltranspeptidase / glutathione hydrolase
MSLARLLPGVVAWLAGTSVWAADLSPGHWPAAIRRELEQKDFFLFPGFGGTVQGGSALVAGSQSRIAIHAGMEALRQGGGAADAAATVALIQIATNFGAVVSYAGASELLYFDARTKKVYALDAGWGSYAQETDPASISDGDYSRMTGKPAPADTTAWGRDTLVPGFMAGIGAMHARFGKLTFSDLFQPAIWYAENGVVVSQGVGGYFHTQQPRLWRTPEGRRFASMPDGALPKAGDLLRQPALALTLKAVAAQGAGYMYSGDWARAYVAAVRAEGGRATLDDLSRYQPIWSAPPSVQFAGATVFGAGENQSGTCPVLEALNLLSGLKADAMGPYWRDPKAFKAYAQALAYAQYAHYAPEVAALERANGFTSDCKARTTARYAGVFAPTLGKPVAEVAAAPQPGHHSNAVIVVDRWGDVAVLVHTINTVTWGNTGIVVGGVPVSDAATVNKSFLEQIKPGAHVPNVMSPVIALRGGKPVLAVASVGASLVPETTRLVGQLLSGRADLQTVMSAPPLLLNPNPFAPGQTLWSRPEAVPAGAYDPAFVAALGGLGVSVLETSPRMVGKTPGVGAIRGTAAVVLIDQPGGAPRTAEIPQAFGVAESDRQIGADAPAEVSLTPAALDLYVGDYQITPRIVTRIVRDGDHLFATTPGRPREALVPDSSNHFFEKIGDAQLTFRPGPSGRADAIVIEREGLETMAPRAQPASGLGAIGPN